MVQNNFKLLVLLTCIANTLLFSNTKGDVVMALAWDNVNPAAFPFWIWNLVNYCLYKSIILVFLKLFCTITYLFVLICKYVL